MSNFSITCEFESSEQIAIVSLSSSDNGNDVIRFARDVIWWLS